MINKLLILVLFALATSPAWATISLTQVKSNNACAGSTTCAVTVTSTGAGHSMVLGIVASVSTTISSATGCSTAWTIVGSSVGDSTGGFVQMAYCLSATGASTTITATTSNSSWNGIAVVWESSTTATMSFDTNGSNPQSCTTSCAGTALTLTGTNSAIFTLAGCGGTCSAITTYTSDLAFPTGDAVGHLLNTASGTAPTFTQTSSTVLNSAALALKDASGGGGVATRGKAVMY